MNDVVILLGGVFVVVCFVLGVLQERKRRAARDARVRPVDRRTLEAVVGLLGRGRRIQAIKELRAGTGMGLAEAKKLTEAIERGHRPPSALVQDEQPDRPTRE